MLGVNIAMPIYCLFCVLFNNTVSNRDNIALVTDECISMEQLVVTFMKETWSGLLGEKFSPLPLEIVRRLESGEW